MGLGTILSDPYVYVVFGGPKKADPDPHLYICMQVYTFLHVCAYVYMYLILICTYTCPYTIMYTHLYQYCIRQDRYTVHINSDIHEMPCAAHVQAAFISRESWQRPMRLVFTVLNITKISELQPQTSEGCCKVSWIHLREQGSLPASYGSPVGLPKRRRLNNSCTQRAYSEEFPKNLGPEYIAPHRLRDYIVPEPPRWCRAIYWQTSMACISRTPRTWTPKFIETAS